jgi:hypothetical protein
MSPGAVFAGAPAADHDDRCNDVRARKMFPGHVGSFTLSARQESVTERRRFFHADPVENEPRHQMLISRGIRGHTQHDPGGLRSFLPGFPSGDHRGRRSISYRVLPTDSTILLTCDAFQRVCGHLLPLS